MGGEEGGMCILLGLGCHGSVVCFNGRGSSRAVGPRGQGIEGLAGERSKGSKGVGVVERVGGLKGWWQKIRRR